MRDIRGWPMGIRRTWAGEDGEFNKIHGSGENGTGSSKKMKMSGENETGLSKWGEVVEKTCSSIF